MKKEIIFEMPSIYRDTFRITGYNFGEGEKSACIVGATRGNEIEQIYICSQIVKTLKSLEERGCIVDGKSVLVIPSVNPYSMNIRKRFWPTDNTDINRMFPGYDLGETTQRIAAGVFDTVKDYKNGIQFASLYIPGVYVPHVRVMRTGYEDVEAAKRFGMPYVILRDPRPYDTTTLNYNWQIWETNAFSVYSGMTDNVDKSRARFAVNAVVNFLRKEGVVKPDGFVPEGYIAHVADERDLVNVRANSAGIIDEYISPGTAVQKGETLARVTDPYDGELREEVTAPCDGIIFYAQESSLVYANAAVYKLITRK